MYTIFESNRLVKKVVVPQVILTHAILLLLAVISFLTLGDLIHGDMVESK